MGLSQKLKIKLMAQPFARVLPLWVMIALSMVFNSFLKIDIKNDIFDMYGALIIQSNIVKKAIQNSE